MKKFKKFIRFVLNSSLREKILFLRFSQLILRTVIIVRFIPIKYYYNQYFIYPESKAVDLQPYRDELRLFNRIRKSSPFFVSCLIESMVIHSFFKKYGLIIPIKIGICTSGEFSAHAWIGNNDSNQEFQMIRI